MSWLGFLLGGCDVEIAGVVANPAGAPVAGAALEDGACHAVSGADGRFLARCLRAAYTFTVSHPTHALAHASVDASGALSPPPLAVTLMPWPSAAGLYLEPALSPLPRVPLARSVAAESQRFCVGADAVPEASGAVSIFDVHAVDWRVYTLDSEGCALVLSRPAGSSWWQPSGTRVAEASRTTLAPGRDRVKFELPAGRHLAVAWFDGFLVPDDVATDTWVAWALAPPGD